MLKTSINKQRSLASLLFLCLTLSVSGCGTVGPFVEPEKPDPEPTGPGLFTGEKGYYSPGGDSQSSNTKTVVDQDSDTDTETDTANFAEFEAYQRWKTEERHSDEYREFKQWLEFKKWKSQQDKQ